MHVQNSEKRKTDISSEAMTARRQARRQWKHIFKEMKDKECQLTIPYPLKILSKDEGKIKILSDKG